VSDPSRVEGSANIIVSNLSTTSHQPYLQQKGNQEFAIWKLKGTDSNLELRELTAIEQSNCHTHIAATRIHVLPSLSTSVRFRRGVADSVLSKNHITLPVF